MTGVQTCALPIWERRSGCVRDPAYRAGNYCPCISIMYGVSEGALLSSSGAAQLKHDRQPPDNLQTPDENGDWVKPMTMRERERERERETLKPSEKVKSLVASPAERV